MKMADAYHVFALIPRTPPKIIYSFFIISFINVESGNFYMCYSLLFRLIHTVLVAEECYRYELNIINSIIIKQVVQ